MNYLSYIYIKLKILFITLFLFSISSCSETEEINPTGLYFEVEKNNEKWVANRIFNGAKVSDNKIFIRAEKDTDSDEHCCNPEVIHLEFDIDNVLNPTFNSNIAFEAESFDLVGWDVANNVYKKTNNSCIDQLVANCQNHLMFLKVDYESKIIEGTFSFRLINNENEEKVFTNGKFRALYSDEPFVK